MGTSVIYVTHGAGVTIRAEFDRQLTSDNGLYAYHLPNQAFMREFSDAQTIRTKVLEWMLRYVSSDLIDIAEGLAPAFTERLMMKALITHGP